MNINDFIIPVTILLVVGLTIMVILGIWKFGQFLFKQKLFESPRFDHFFEHFMHWFDKNDRYGAYKVFNAINNLNSDHTEKRNDFWTTYGQILICVFIVCIIALLLLTKVISAEAGLPILSAISGFAIAKSSTVRNNNNDNNLNTNG